VARVAVIGLWHLGCVVGTVLAERGHVVCGTDFDAETVRHLQQGAPPLFEPGLTEAISKRVREGRLAFRENTKEALAGADYAVIAFDTPVNAQDESDLAPIERAVDAIGEFASGDIQIVVMSQVPAGTCALLDARLRARAPELRFSLVYQPENLRLGEALETFRHPDFIVLGAENEAAIRRWLPLGDVIDVPRLVMSWSSAEMSKHALNAFLATSISFVNDLADAAEAAGADVRDVVRALKHDRRIGAYAFLNPGPGFAGGTLGRDVQTLRSLAARGGCATRLLDATLEVNCARLPRLVEKLRAAYGPESRPEASGLGTGLRGKRVALLGLTYKPGTSTLRRSHAVEFARLLVKEGATVQAYDPKVSEPTSDTQDIRLCSDVAQAVTGADAVALLTPWPEFRQLDLRRLKQLMREPVLLDAHNFLDDRAARDAGFLYVGIGLPEFPNPGTATESARAGAR
jgi:UDPglucose 6-dehydrogenase